MKKSLVPLIVSLSLIVLLTTVIVNTRPEMRKPSSADSGTKKPISIYLNNTGLNEGSGLHKREQHIMDERAVLNMLIQAYSNLHKGKVVEAEDKVKTVLIFQPENCEALSLLGKIYYLQHKYREAEMIFRQQVRLNKKSASAYNNLGQVLLKQKKCSQAALQFRAALELDPESGLIALNLSGAYSQEGKKKESLLSFKRAFKLLGTRVITVSNHPALDNIRQEKEFKDILKKAYKKLSLEQKKIDQTKSAKNK